MNTHMQLGLRMFRSTSAFLMADETIRTNLGTLARQVVALNGVIDRVDVLAAEQRESDRAYHDAARQAQHHVRVLMRRYVRPLVRVGRALYSVNSPRGAAFRVPLSEKGSYDTMIAGAEAVADRAEERLATFIRAGLDMDFIDRLRAAVEALREAVSTEESYYERRTAATAAMYREFARGRRVVLLLDARVVPQLQGTGSLVRWKQARRLPRAGAAGVGTVRPVRSGSVRAA